jgi:hypothetical protein
MELMEVWQPEVDRRRTYRPVIAEVVRRAEDDVPVEVTVLLLPDERNVDAAAAGPSRT